MIIKLLLIAAALGFGVLILRERGPGQHQLLRRLSGLLVVVTGIVAILWPATTTYIANAIGVSRGTDLVLYIVVMAFLYNTVATSQRMHRLESTLARLARELAIAHPAFPSEPRENPADNAPERP